MKKILITVSSGFVSRYFIEFLEQQQIKSSILGLGMVSDEPSTSLRYVECPFRQIDLLDDAKSIVSSIYQFHSDSILYLASYSSVAFSCEWLMKKVCVFPYLLYKVFRNLNVSTKDLFTYLLLYFKSKMK